MDLAKHSGFTNNFFNGFSRHLQRVVQRFQPFFNSSNGDPRGIQRLASALSRSTEKH